MTKDEALRLALDAMEYTFACSKNQLTTKTKREYDQDLLMKAITAIKEALETKDEPVAWEQFHEHMNWLPEHKCGLYLTHNEHRNVYETVEEFYTTDYFVSKDEWEKAIAEDNVWVLQWYPHTPIGFNIIAASSLEVIQAKLKERNQ